jgi:hypothetical protein
MLKIHYAAAEYKRVLRINAIILGSLFVRLERLGSAILTKHFYLAPLFSSSSSCVIKSSSSTGARCTS